MTTAKRIRAILVNNYSLNPDDLTPDARLDDLGIDSLGMAELLFTIEDEFSVVLASEPINLATFGDVVELIDGLLAGKSEGAMAEQNSHPAARPSVVTSDGAQLAS